MSHSPLLSIQKGGCMKVLQMYRTLALASHCLLEQGYSVEPILGILEFIEARTKVPAERALQEITETRVFHREYDKEEVT